MSAASRATSTAEATEIPTSAACKRGSVIDPVSHIAHDVAAAFEGVNDAVFLHRRDAREYRRLFRPVLERGIAGRFELLTQHDGRILDADLFANVTCHQFVVAGQDLDVTPSRFMAATSLPHPDSADLQMPGSRPTPASVHPRLKICPRGSTSR